MLAMKSLINTEQINRLARTERDILAELKSR